MTRPYLFDSTKALFDELVSFLVPSGYYFYMRTMSPETEVTKFDLEILAQLETAKWKLSRVKDQADVRYLRFARWCIFIATRGTHPFYDECARQIYDIRKTPLGFCGHCITCKRVQGTLQASVQVDDGYLEMFQSKLENMTTRASLAEISDYFRTLPFDRFPEVLTQIGKMLQQVNRLRRKAGLQTVTRSAAGLPEGEVEELKRTKRPS